MTFATYDLLRAATQHVVYRRRVGLVHMNDEPVTFWINVGLYGVLWTFFFGLPRCRVWKTWLQTQRHGWLAAYGAQNLTVIATLCLLAGLDATHPARPLIWTGLALIFAFDIPFAIWIVDRMPGRAKT